MPKLCHYCVGHMIEGDYITVTGTRGKVTQYRCKDCGKIVIEVEKIDIETIVILVKGFEDG